MIPNADQSVSAPLARLYSSDVAIWEGVVGGYFVRSGCVVTAGSGLSVNVSAGIVYVAKSSQTVGALTNFSTGIAADATNPKWVLLEVSSTGVVAANAGTAQANPEPPTPTAGKTVIAALYIPANATAVEVWAATGNTASKCQIVDKSQRGQLGSYLFATDTAMPGATALTSAYASILSAAVALPAGSLQVGDAFVIEGSYLFRSTTTATIHTLNCIFGGIAFAIPTPSLSASAGDRFVNFKFVFSIKAIGSGTACRVIAKGDLDWGAPLSFATDAHAQSTVQNAGFDSTAAQTIDVQAKITTAGGVQQVTNLDEFVVVKHPA